MSKYCRPRDTFHDVFVFPEDLKSIDLTGGSWVVLSHKTSSMMRSHIARLRLINITCPSTALALCLPQQKQTTRPVVFLSSQLLQFLNLAPGMDTVQISNRKIFRMYPIPVSSTKVTITDFYSLGSCLVSAVPKSIKLIAVA